MNNDEIFIDEEELIKEMLNTSYQEHVKDNIENPFIPQETIISKSKSNKSKISSKSSKKLTAFKAFQVNCPSYEEYSEDRLKFELKQYGIKYNGKTKDSISILREIYSFLTTSTLPSHIERDLLLFKNGNNIEAKEEYNPKTEKKSKKQVTSKKSNKSKTSNKEIDEKTKSNISNNILESLIEEDINLETDENQDDYSIFKLLENNRDNNILSTPYIKNNNPEYNIIISEVNNKQNNLKINKHSMNRDNIDLLKKILIDKHGLNVNIFKIEYMLKQYFSN